MNKILYMKRYFLLLSILAFSFSSCKKSGITAAQQASIDDETIQSYLTANALTGFTRDASGLYYKVVTPGTGAYPVEATSTVAVSYIGKLTDGTVFDQQASIALALTGVIKGWQIGIPYINTGGTIILIIPSGLGYGKTGSGAVPANAILIFNITLQGFHN